MWAFKYRDLTSGQFSLKYHVCLTSAPVFLYKLENVPFIQWEVQIPSVQTFMSWVSEVARIMKHFTASRDFFLLSSMAIKL